MRSAIAAEWILSLVTAPDRAAATVGDLMEEGSAHGVGWFWSNVLRTASGHVWRDVSDSPLRVLGFAFAGLLAHIVLCLLYEFLVNNTWNRLAGHSGWWGYQPAIYTAGIYALTVLKFTIAGFLTGWLVAARSESLAAVFAAVALIAVCFAETLYRVATHPAPGFGLAVFSAMEMCVVVGAIFFRRRTARRQPSGT
jgi:hypothetical protein